MVADAVASVEGCRDIAAVAANDRGGCVTRGEEREEREGCCGRLGNQEAEHASPPARVAWLGTGCASVWLGAGGAARQDAQPNRARCQPGCCTLCLAAAPSRALCEAQALSRRQAGNSRSTANSQTPQQTSPARAATALSTLPPGGQGTWGWQPAKWGCRAAVERTCIHRAHARARPIAGPKPAWPWPPPARLPAGCKLFFCWSARPKTPLWRQHCQTQMQAQCASGGACATAPPPPQQNRRTRRRCSPVGWQCRASQQQQQQQQHLELSPRAADAQGTAGVRPCVLYDLHDQVIPYEQVRGQVARVRLCMEPRAQARSCTTAAAPPAGVGLAAPAAGAGAGVPGAWHRRGRAVHHAARAGVHAGHGEQ